LALFYDRWQDVDKGEITTSQIVDDARKAVEIAKDYAARSMGALFWRDVLECEVVKETNEWRVVFVASPSILAPYYRYEVFIDSKTGRVTRARRIGEWRRRESREGGEG
jgi:hypothetical protein